MDLGLRGRTALVAGASSGLGLACARRFAAEGADVAICARTPARVDDAVADLRARGAEASGEALDVRDHDAVEVWVARAVENHGTADIVVANAGGPPLGDAFTFRTADYREALELNLLASIHLVQTALPHMLRTGWGRVLFVTSTSAKEPLPNLALSNVARAGVLGYAKSLVHALRGSGVTVNTLCPGYTRTDRLLRSRPNEQDLRELAEREVPVGRVGDPDEFAAAAAFLASDPAAFINGAVLPVDGGMVRSLY